MPITRSESSRRGIPDVTTGPTGNCANTPLISVDQHPEFGETATPVEVIAPLSAPGAVPAASPVPGGNLRAKGAPLRRTSGASRSALSACSSLRRKAEAEARCRLAEKQLKAAEAAAHLEQMKLELLEIESEEEQDFEYDSDKSSHVEKWVEHTNQMLLGEVNKEQIVTTKDSEIKELANAIIQATQNSSTPNQTMPPPPKYLHELPQFEGSCDEWLAFKRAYEDTVMLFDDLQNMARLRKAVRGNAREVVKSLLFVSTDPRNVIAALQRRFGRPDVIVLTEMERLKTLPRLNDSPREICVFASRINNTVATIKALNKPQYLHSPEIIRSIVEKLTPILRYKWYEFRARSAEEDHPELVIMDNFLSIEADLCGAYAPPEIVLDKNVKRKTYENQRYPVHATKEEQRSTSSRPQMKKNCANCNSEEHWLYECSQFKTADTDQRWEMVRGKKICFRCLRSNHWNIKCRSPPCKKCKRGHHIMLHSSSPPTVRREENAASSTPHQAAVVNQEEVQVTSSVCATAASVKAYLKMIPVEIYGPKGSARVLALLDEGSTVTLLDSDIAEKIGAVGVKECLTISTVGGRVENYDSMRLDLRIRGINRNDRRLLTGVRTVHHLKLSAQEVSKETINTCKHLKDIADELTYDYDSPKLLIGQDNWNLIVSRSIKKGNASLPVASLTTLGWVLHGKNVTSDSPNLSVNHCDLTSSEEKRVEDIIRHHFSIESLGVEARRPTTDAEGKALTILENTANKLPCGRYECGLLWANENEGLPDNYKQAHTRLMGIERKLDKDEKLKKEYETQIQHLLDSGYAEEAPPKKTPGKTFYLPHFAVVHPVKKKIRIVFDAAARFDGKSLNDALLPGPDLLQSLFGVLVRFRQGPVAVVADIKEMFLQIKTREDDRDSLRFLWRGADRHGPPLEYRMTSVIFGAASSPSTAIFVKNKNAMEYEAQYPEAARAIVRNHYMDDYLQSFDHEDQAIKTAKEVYQIHRQAGFELRGWASNKKKVLQYFAGEENTEVEIQLGQEKEEKTLGLRWQANEDVLSFNNSLRNTPEEILQGSKVPTKRQVTSAVMSTFDPLGLASPILIQGKRLMQESWRAGTKWDEHIEADQVPAWKQYLQDIKQLHHVKIPRCIAPLTKNGELHTFTDASETTYAAASYWRSFDSQGNICVTLVAGKARVAPTKPVSIPRLELQAALMGSRLAKSIEQEIDLPVTRKVFWTDSSTVLQWIKTEPRKFKAFVAHRLAEIEELTKPSDWRWVPTKLNPADDATRSAPKQFDEDARWFTGPSFLRLLEEEWPQKQFKKSEDSTGEEKRTENVATLQLNKFDLATPDEDRFSGWTRLLRTTARVLMFIDLCRKNCINKGDNEVTNSLKDDDWKPYKTKKGSIKQKTLRTQTEKLSNLRPLKEEYLQKAEDLLIKKCQNDSFAEEIRSLQKDQPLDRSSKLKKIEVYLDSQKILRLKTRISKIKDVSEDVKSPALLDGRHRITRLLIDHYHKRYYHGNHATVINELRQKYWILAIRHTVKNVIHQCQQCKVRKGLPEIPPLGDFPPERLQHHKYPFSCTAVDYFGPMYVTIGRRNEKRWGVLFTCLTTRAVHLELASSLSTNSMIMALRRMAARRGTPKILYSDNGTNFVGADRELHEEIKKLNKADIELAVEHEGITWKFIPPGAPSMGGAWERMVRSVKASLSAILKERSPPEEVLHTLLVEVEHTVNSRPLTHISMDPNDEECLTPNHFLLGRSSGTPPPGAFEDRELITRANWRTAQRLADHFWKRWLREYLPSIAPRRLKGKDPPKLQEGDIAIVVDSTLPRNSWPKGEIIRTYTGPDGRIRIAEIRTRNGIVRRPVSRIIVVVPVSSLPKK